MKSDKLYSIWTLLYEGDPPADPPAPPLADPPAPPPADPPKSFTQEQLNKILAEEKRKHQTNNKAILEEIDALKTRSNLNADEREALDTRVTELNRQLLTKEELAAEDKKKLNDEHKTEIERLTGERNDWENRYTESTVMRSITDAAVVNNAYNPEQVVAILRPLTQLAEDVDAEGKPTGSLISKVLFPDVDKDGKRVTLDLTPTEAVKRMSEMDKYMNLFKSDGTGGLGGTTQPGGKPLDIAELAKNPEAYRKAKAEGKIPQLN